RQSEIISSITTIKVNFNKDSDSRKNAEYIKKRLGALDALWEEFEQNHSRISDHASEADEYFRLNTYQVGKDLYQSVRILLSSYGKSSKSTQPDGEVDELLAMQRTNFRALSRLIKSIKVENISDKWELEDELNGVQSIWKIIDAQHLKIDHILAGGDISYDEEFTRHELAYKNIKLHRYNNEQALFTHQIEIFLNQPNIQKQSSSEIKRLYDTTTECIHAIHNLGVNTNAWDPLLVHLLCKKLDTDTQTDYREARVEPRKLPKLDELMTFLEAIHISKCAVCNLNHNRNLFSCKKFINMTPDLQMRIVTQSNICKNCLFSHDGNECTSTKRCKSCQGNHHTILHEACMQSSKHQSSSPSSTSGPSAKTPNKQPNANHVAVDDEELLLTTLSINVRCSDGTYITLRALLDQGSQISLISENAVQRLGLQRRRYNASVSGIGSGASQSKGLVSIDCQSIYGDYNFTTEALVLSRVASNLPSVQFKKQSWPHLQHLQLADPEYNVSKPIDLLLDVSIYSQIIMDGLIKGPSQAPIAQQTALGWILSGNVRTFNCHIVTNNISDLSKYWEIEDSIIVQLEQEISEIEHYDMLLKNTNEAPMRLRRGLVNGVGYIANSLFGVLDESNLNIHHHIEVPEVSMLNRIMKTSIPDNISMVEDHQVIWDQLRAQIDEVKEQSSTDLSIHDVHHYTVLYISVAAVIILGGVVVYLIRSRRAAARAAASPAPQGQEAAGAGPATVAPVDPAPVASHQARSVLKCSEVFTGVVSSKSYYVVIAAVAVGHAIPAQWTSPPLPAASEWTVRVVGNRSEMFDKLVYVELLTSVHHNRGRAPVPRPYTLDDRVEFILVKELRDSLSAPPRMNQCPVTCLRTISTRLIEYSPPELRPSHPLPVSWSSRRL
ncbi:hypothetical protein HW555_013000, partial [Spodoptera exigua]